MIEKSKVYIVQNVLRKFPDGTIWSVLKKEEVAS